MKTLIFGLIFSTLVMAEPQEMRLSDSEINQKLVGVAVDISNQKILEGVAELQPCRDGFRFTPGTPPTPAQLTTLQSCIDGVFRGKPADQIAAISDKMNLETYNLIPSKSVQNVTNYLTEKTYKSLTGVDLKEQSTAAKLQQMKFGNKKMLDQKDFFELYKNQVSKNALYEVSRFCFKDLRNSSASASAATNFMDHWNNLDEFARSSTPTVPASGTAISPTDSGTPAFDVAAGSSTGAAATTQGSYTNLMQTIFGAGTTPPNPTKLSNFFQYCAKQIDELCQSYEQSCSKASSTPASGAASTTACAAATATGASNPNPTAPGARACLAKTRIVAFKKALAASDEFVREFTDQSKNGNDFVIALNANQIVNRYAGGRGQNEKSYNELTNSASVDFFKANESENYQDAQNCIRNGGRDCEKFDVSSDAEEKILQDNTLVYSAKRAAELARVRALSGQPLDEFLAQNYPDIKKLRDDGTLTRQGRTLEDAIAQRWDGRRESMMNEIKNRIGSRQVTAVEAQTAGVKDTVAKANATQALTEKTRLAQVVLFNNIISSSLELQTTSGQRLGRNVQALSNELDASQSEVQGSLFSNLRTLTDQAPGTTAPPAGSSDSVNGIGFLYKLIGLPDDPAPGSTPRRSGNQ